MKVNPSTRAVHQPPAPFLSHSPASLSHSCFQPALTCVRLSVIARKEKGELNFAIRVTAGGSLKAPESRRRQAPFCLPAATTYSGFIQISFSLSGTNVAYSTGLASYFVTRINRNRSLWIETSWGHLIRLEVCCDDLVVWFLRLSDGCDSCMKATKSTSGYTALNSHLYIFRRFSWNIYSSFRWSWLTVVPVAPGRATIK